MFKTRFCAFVLLPLLFPVTRLSAQDEYKPPVEPEITSIFPLGGQSGTVAEMVIRGKTLDGTYAVWFDTEGLKARVEGIEETEFKEFEFRTRSWETRPGHRVLVRLEIDGSTEAGTYSLRVVSRRGVSNKLPFRVTSDPVLAETEAFHQSPSEAQQVRFPVVVNGKLSQKGELDYYGFEVADGQELTFEVISHLGIEPQLTLYELTGSWLDPDHATELAFHLGRLGTPDPLFQRVKTQIPPYEKPRLTYQFPQEGRYLVQVGAFLSKGGPDCPYQLRIAPTEPQADREGANGSVQGVPSIWGPFSRKIESDRLELLWSRTVRETVDPSPSTTGLAHLFEQEPNQLASQALEVAVPSIIEGAIEHPGDVDSFRFKVKDGEKLAFEIETPGVTPPFFNPHLVVLDSEGREFLSNLYLRLGRQFQFYKKTVEAKTLHIFESGGEYTLQVRDITSRQGDPSFVYRVLIRPQIPHMGGIQVKEDRVNLKAGGAKKLTVVTEQEEGFGGEIVLNVENLPPGVEALPGTEVEPAGGINPDEGPKERFVPKSQKATVLLVVSADAPVTPMPQLIRIMGRAVVQGTLGPTLLIQEMPVMVVRHQEVASASHIAKAE